MSEIASNKALESAKRDKAIKGHMSESREKLSLFLNNRLGMFGLMLVILFFVSAIFAPYFATHDPF